MLIVTIVLISLEIVPTPKMYELSILLMIERINLKLTVKLLISFVSLTVISIVILVSLSLSFINNALSTEGDEFLSSTSNYKRNLLESYLTEKEKNLKDLASGASMYNFYENIFAHVESVSDPIPVNNDDYAKHYNSSVNRFSNFISTYGFDDVYFIAGQTGQIIFSVKNKRDLGVVLSHGKYKTSALARIWKKVMMTGRFNIIDFEPFAQSGNTFTMFLGVPVFHDDKLVGTLVALVPDKNIDLIVNKPNSSRIELESFILGYSSSNHIVYKSNPRNTNSQVGDRNSDPSVESALKKGEVGVSLYTDESGHRFAMSHVPFLFNGLEWMIFTTYPEDEARGNISRLILYYIFAVFFILTLIISIGYYLANKITQPFIHIRNSIRDFSKGRIPSLMTEITSRSEIGEIQSAINDMVVSMNEYVSFANKIGNNQLDASFKETDDKDILGQSLISMQKNLVEADKNARERKNEEEKQKWMTEGVAYFGDILRQQQNSMADHGFIVISKLVDFLDVCQGGLFVVSDTEDKIDLLASFAYGRKKFSQKSFEIGEGLIGACVVEKETIYLTNIPDDFPEITSGLGGTQPRFVLMVPLKIDKLVLGVVELISLNEFKPHEISFVEKISENIASSINSSLVANKTKRLLDEAKVRSEQLVTQEEELRQNLEELHATQEESQRREQETTAVLDILYSNSIVVELSLDGKIVFANKNFCNMLNANIEKIQGLFYSAISPNANKKVIDSVVAGHKVNVSSKLNYNGIEFYVKEHFAITYNQYFEPKKIYVIIQDISDEHRAIKHK